jgi:hypothetical protein
MIFRILAEKSLSNSAWRLLKGGLTEGPGVFQRLEHSKLPIIPHIENERDLFDHRTNGTQKIFFIKNQLVTIPVPGTEMLKLALVAGFAVIGPIPISLTD